MKEKSQVKIFISYRRKGGIDTARWLYDQLRERGYDVFLDMEGLRSGAFNQALYHEIKSRDVFLMVLSKDSLKRCSSKHDWVRQELSYAFRCGLNVIPVMKEDFQFPNRLPADISPIRSCNGLRIDYQFFDAFLGKLEEYILAKPKSGYTYIPEPEPAVDWIKYAVAGVAAVAVLAGALLLGKGCDNAPAPIENNTPISTTAPKTTAPPATEGQQLSAVQEIGNSTGNQCNAGIAAINQHALQKNAHSLSTLDNWRYHVGTLSGTIYGRITPEKSTALLTEKNLSYALVTTDWFYYAVTKGDERTLYRAPRTETTNPITNSEKLISGIMADNNIMIDGEYAYYWRDGKGIYKLDLATREETFLLELDTTWTADTIGKSGNWVYLFTGSTISRVHVWDGRFEIIFKLEEHFADASIAAANVSDSWIYFSVTDLGKDPYHHYDRVYRMHTDGSEMSRVFVADTSICRINRICVTDTNVHFDMDCGEDGHCHYFISQSTGKIGGHEMSHAQPHAETPCVTVGNTVSNLCNLSSVAPKDAATTTYKTSNSAVMYNHFSDAGISYSYSVTMSSIQVGWTENGTIKTQNLLENVNCHYLYARPDWLYFVLEDNGIYTLYRAQNNMEEHTIGELQSIAAEIYIPNQVAILNDSVYYWKNPDGLYTARTDGSDAKVLYNNNGKGINVWPTFHVDSEKLYFWTAGGGIYTVNLEDGDATHILNTKEQPGRLTHAVEAGGKLYYAVEHVADGVQTAPSEIWCSNTDGTEPTLVATCPEGVRVRMLASSGAVVYFKGELDGVTKLWKITADGELSETFTYE